MIDRRRPWATALTALAGILIVAGSAALISQAGSGGAGGSASASASASPMPTGSPPPTQSPSPSLAVPSGNSTEPSVSPAASPSAPGSPSPSAQGSPSPSPNSGGFVQSDQGIVYRTADGRIVPVPGVAGLQVQLQSGRAIYSAQASNRYGLKTDSYAGEFMPLVTTGQPDGSAALTGGVVLAPQVIARLVTDRLAAAQSDSDRWVITLPVDIRSAAGTMVAVSFDRYGLAGWSNTPRVQVRFQGSLPVVEAVPANTGFHVLVEELGVTRWQVIDPLRLTLPGDSIDPAHAMNQLLIYGAGAPSVATDQFFDTQAAVGSVMLNASGDVSVSLVVAGSRADVGPANILAIGDVPVFAAAA